MDGWRLKISECCYAGSSYPKNMCIRLIRDLDKQLFSWLFDIHTETSLEAYKDILSQRKSLKLVLCRVVLLLTTLFSEVDPKGAKSPTLPQPQPQPQPQPAAAVAVAAWTQNVNFL